MNNLKRIYNFLKSSGSHSRAVFWKLFFKKSGRNLSIGKGCILASPGGVTIGADVVIGDYCYIGGEDLKIGDHVFVGQSCHFESMGGLTIGNYVLMGPNCELLTTNHEFSDWRKPIVSQGLKKASVKIGGGCLAGGECRRTSRSNCWTRSYCCFQRGRHKRCRAIFYCWWNSCQTHQISF